jgi:glutathione synthase/RimK-type ligase-like ATP-grasp enzyme
LGADARVGIWRAGTGVTRIALATGAPDGQVVAEDRMLRHALARRGLEAKIRNWQAPADSWKPFDAVVVRSCWDYPAHHQAFLEWAADIERLGVVLINPAPLLAWNADKRYLCELERRGVPIVPTRVIDTATELGEVLETMGWDEAVVKPAIASGGHETWRTSRAEASAHAARIHALAKGGRSLLVQPFLREIRRRGEWSLVFIAGIFSHAILRWPAPGDFRVQDSFGGTARLAAAPRFLVREAATVLANLPEQPGYARIDGLLSGTDFLLMELELIEPVLFLDADPQAAPRMANMIEERLAGRQEAATY